MRGFLFALLLLITFLTVQTAYAATCQTGGRIYDVSDVVWSKHHKTHLYCAGGNQWRYLAQWGLTSGNSLVYSGGNVGIGVDNPTASLDVNGIIRSVNSGGYGVYIEAQDGSNGFGARLRYGGSGDHANIFQIQRTSGHPVMTFHLNNVGIGTTDPQTMLHVEGRGYFAERLGIGISNPATPLHVSGIIRSSDRFVSWPIEDNAQGRAMFLGVLTDTNNASNGWDAGDIALGLSGGTNGGSNTLRLLGDGQRRLHLDVYNGDVRVRIGRVGIGVTGTPTERLQVAGRIDMTNNRIIRVADPVENTDAANKAYVDSLGNRSCANGQILKFQSGSWACAGDNSGGGNDNLGSHTATQDLDLAGNTIINLADPSDPQDAANKAYVDTVVASLASCETGPVGTVCADGAIYAGKIGGVRFYAAPSDESGTITWNNGSSNWIVTNATSLTDGLANTNTLVGLTDAAAPYAAAVACRARGANWYLPSKDELNVMYTNKTAIGGFSTSNYYWSSSEYSNRYAWVQRLSDGSQSGFNKHYGRLVRCVRRGDDGTTAGDNLGDHTASQNLDMATHAIVNVKDPVNAQDAVTKSYVDMRVPICPSDDTLVSNGTGWICSSDNYTDCTAPWGGVVAHLSSIIAYQAATVPYGNTCASQTRSCNDGVLSGSYTHQSCTVGSPSNCTLDGVTVAHGSSRTFYAYEEHANCAGNSQSRSCNNGTLSGSTSYRYASCEAPPVPACETGPVGTVCPDGAIYAGSVGGVRFYAAPSDESGTMTWNNGSSNWIVTNATSLTDGLANTNILVGLTDAAAPYAAAVACRARGTNWYLPSKDELNVMYTNKTAIGGFSTSNYYWSSSEYNFFSAWVQRLSDGSQTNYAKYLNFLVRCARR